MVSMLGYLNKVVTRISQVGVVVASAGLVVMMLLTGGDVLLRYLLNRPIAGSMEITEFLMSLTIGFGLAYCALKMGHIRVDLILAHVPPKVRRILDVITYIMSFMYCTP